MSGRRTHTLSSVLLASNLFLSAYCPAAGSERYFVEDYFAVAAVFGAAEIIGNLVDLRADVRSTCYVPTWFAVAGEAFRVAAKSLQDPSPDLAVLRIFLTNRRRFPANKDWPTGELGL